MFDGCTSLTELFIHANDVNAYNCLSDWLLNAGSAGGTVHCKASVKFTIEDYIPNNWTVTDDLDGQQE